MRKRKTRAVILNKFFIFERIRVYRDIITHAS